MGVYKCLYCNSFLSTNFKVALEDEHYICPSCLDKNAIEIIENSAKDTQIGGDHYKMPIQPIEFINKNNLGFIQGNIIKYICRYKNKNGLEDLKKIKHYVDLLIELEYNSNTGDK